MNKNTEKLTDEQLIELLACESVRLALSQSKARENKHSGFNWKGVGKRIVGKGK